MESMSGRCGGCQLEDLQIEALCLLEGLLIIQNRPRLLIFVSSSEQLLSPLCPDQQWPVLVPVGQFLCDESYNVYSLYS